MGRAGRNADDYNSETHNWGVGKLSHLHQERALVWNLCAEDVLVHIQAGLRLSQPRKPARPLFLGPPSCAGYAGYQKGNLGGRGEGVSLGVCLGRWCGYHGHPGCQGEAVLAGAAGLSRTPDESKHSKIRASGWRTKTPPPWMPRC